MSKEKQLFEDLVEIFEEEYEKRRLITPQNTAEKMTAKGYRKQSEPISCGHEKGGEWTKHLDEWDCEYAKCSCCGEEFYDSSGEDTIDMFYKFCPNCGAKMKGGGRE